MKSSNGQNRESITARMQKLTSGEHGDKIRYFTNTFFNFPPNVRAEIKAEWDAYFERCRDSEEGRDFYALKQGMDPEILARVRHKLKNGFNKITTPSGFDPEEWQKSSWGIEYRMLKSKLDEYQLPSNKVAQTVSVW